MDKPRMKSRLAIDAVFSDPSTINVYCDKVMAGELTQFGRVADFPRARPNFYQISVDGRFDFNEVLAYIKDLEALPAIDDDEAE